MKSLLIFSVFLEKLRGYGIINFVKLWYYEDGQNSKEMWRWMKYLSVVKRLENDEDERKGN
jgi:hypothetical protein